MRRTYKSKKDTTNVVERRDLFQNLDGRSTAYDAFSMQNIRQTKRELSCVGSSNPLGVSSNKVRKKKYVKRIIKEVETPCQERMSHSAYLTPDKSIRVNKVLDPFDLLLMSSPAGPVKCADKKVDCLASKVKLFDQLVPKKEGRTYIRRTTKKNKKFNYSSTESSDSDKENSNERQNKTQNTSDIRTHKLIVEREVKPIPNKIDESINNIVNNLSLLNKLKNKYNTDDSINKSFKLNRHRLTKNIQSPLLQKSPLCSTPFKAKYRGESIFKFSPIATANEDKSPKYTTINEDDSDSNHSLILQEKVKISIKEIANVSNILVPVDKIEYGINNEVDTEKYDEDVIVNKEQSEAIKQSSNCAYDSNTTPSTEISSLQTTEIEPFLGFSHNAVDEVIAQSEDQTSFIDDSIAKNDITELDVSENDLSLKDQNNASDSGNDVTQLKVWENTQFLEGNQNDTCEDNCDNEHSNISIDTCADINDDKQDNVTAASEENDVVYHNNENIAISAKIDSDNNGNVTVASEQSDVDNHNNVSYGENEEQGDDSLSLQSADDDKDSLYDTCTSDQSSIQETEDTEQPVVLLQRMNDSSFFRYYDKMSQKIETDKNFASENTDPDECSLTCEFASIIDSNSSNQSHENVSEIESEEENDTDENVIDDYYDEVATNNDDKDSSSNNEEEKCISFVTTRRRNEVTNDSMMLMFNDSYCSTSTDCDKTVLSNNIEKTEAKNIGNNDTLTDVVADCEDNEKADNIIDLNKDSEHSDDPTIENDSRISFNTTRNSFVTDRKSSIRHRKSSIKPGNSLIPTQSSKLPRRSIKQDLESSRMSCIKPDNLMTTESLKLYRESKQDLESSRMSCFDTKPGIVLQPGKKWERSLSIYRRMTMMNDHFDHSMLDETDTASKGRKYRQSIISTMELQDCNSSLHNESINSRRSTFVSKPSRSTIIIVKDPNGSRFSLCNTTVFDDIKGFLNEECDDTIIELSKLSIADQTHEVTVLDSFHDTPNRIATPRDYVLRRCSQTDAILFDECYPDTVLKNCHKIGEGVYGEVFLWRDRDGRARVLKIVPIAGNLKVNGESQKDFHEIISEIVIAMELSALRAPIADIERHFDEGKDVKALDLHTIENASDIFNEVLAVRCVYGSYPSRLLDLWDLYDECKGSENDNPAILPLDQQYIVLELANAGQDLESYQFNNAEQAHALFLQVAYGLAVAEEAFQFEHRDLHWGNVLIAPTEKKLATFVIRGRAYRVPRCGVSATIIDYSLSRVSLRLAAGDSAALYNDLARDESLFDAVGDYQFQVYRLMRDKLGNDWKNFEPYTNILWLHYTVDKMITALRYKRTNTKIHKHYIDKLKGIKNRILDYGSAAQFVLTDNEI